jgi:hypothetical protein
MQQDSNVVTSQIELLRNALTKHLAKVSLIKVVSDLVLAELQQPTRQKWEVPTTLVAISLQLGQLLLNRGPRRIQLLEEVQEANVVEASNALQVEQEATGILLRVQQQCHLQQAKDQIAHPCTILPDVRVNIILYQVLLLQHK